MYNSGIISQIFEEAGVDEGVISGVLAFMIGYFVVFGIIMLVMYLLEAIALFKMAKTAGFSAPWRSFIPFASTFLFGKLAEKYRRKDGKPSAKFGGILLALEIIMLIVSIAFCVFAIYAVLIVIQYADISVTAGTDMTLDMFSSLIPMILIYIVLIGVSIAYIVLFYVALWRIYASFDYGNATLFLVLSIFFSFLAPIFLFVIRNKQPVFDPREHFNYLMNNE
ncbi:MAG: hypothetical protein ACI4F7_11115 [Acutalibacteraceae bacterium]